MSNHSFKFYEAGPLRHYARCICGWRCPDQGSKQLAEDETIKHEAVVERVRTHLATATPSLKQQRDFFEMMAADAHESAPHRDLWRQLARELGHRVNDGVPTQEQLELPFPTSLEVK